jgi:lipopolysaccharide biosynthesis glycosyltransferase
LHLIYAADAKVAMPLAVSLSSVLRRTANDVCLLVYVVDGGMTAIQKKNVERVARRARPGVETPIHWVIPDLEWWGSRRLDFRHSNITEATMYRFGLPWFLPEDAAHAVYLDCDVIAKADVSQLIRHISSSTVAVAVPDYPMPTWGHRYGNTETPAILGIDHKKPYFNAGIMGINVQKWREEETTAKAIEFVETYREYLSFFSQDPLNYALYGQWESLPLSWNFQPTCRDTMNRRGLSLKGVFGVDFVSLQREAKLVHFTGAKPWDQGWTNPERPAFLQELRASRWFGPIGYLAWITKWYARLASRMVDKAWLHRIRPRMARILPSRRQDAEVKLS